MMRHTASCLILLDLCRLSCGEHSWDEDPSSFNIIGDLLIVSNTCLYVSFMMRHTASCRILLDLCRLSCGEHSWDEDPSSFKEIY